GRLAAPLFNRRDLCRQEFVIDQPNDGHSLKAGDSDLENSVHLCLATYHARCDAHWIEGFKSVGIIIDLTSLCNHEDAAVTCDGKLNRAPREIAPHKDRQDRLRKQHEVPHSYNRDAFPG